MINLSSQAWYSRWFLLWNQCWAEFTDGRGVLRDQRTNLCTYFWVSIGAPVFILALHLAVLAFGIWAIFVYGVTKLTLGGFLIELGIIALLVGLFWGLSKLRGLISSRPVKPRKAQPERGPSLLFQYLRAVKQRVCPIISLEDQS